MVVRPTSGGCSQLSVLGTTGKNAPIHTNKEIKMTDRNDLEYVRAVLDDAVTLEATPDTIVRALEIVDGMIIDAGDADVNAAAEATFADAAFEGAVTEQGPVPVEAQADEGDGDNV